MVDILSSLYVIIIIIASHRECCGEPAGIPTLPYIIIIISYNHTSHKQNIEFLKAYTIRDAKTHIIYYNIIPMRTRHFRCGVYCLNEILK